MTTNFSFLALSALLVAGSPLSTTASAQGPKGPAASATTAPVRHSRAALHSLAFVNDSRSHGQIGDAFLSLNETILLTNQQLTVAQLSPMEQAQLGGFGTDIAFADINAQVVPSITMERDFDVVIDKPHGFEISSSNGRSFINMTGFNGFQVTSNFFKISDLEIRGGTAAINLNPAVNTATATDPNLLVENCNIFGQSVAGVIADFAENNDFGRLNISKCDFSGMPTAIQFDSSGSGRSDTLLFDNLTTRNVAQGYLGTHAGGGGSDLYLVECCNFDATATAFTVNRLAGSTRAIEFEALYLEAEGVDALRIQGDAGLTKMRLRMATLQTIAPSGFALDLSPVTPGGACVVDGAIDELRAQGNLRVAKSGNGTFEVGNARAFGNTATFAVADSGMAVHDSVLGGYATTVTGSGPLNVRETAFLGTGSIDGTAATALSLDLCFTATTSLTGTMQITAPYASAQRGGFEFTPDVPAIGGTITVTTALPPGLIGLYALGNSSLLPIIGPRPVHIYAVPGSAVTVPGIFRNQDTFNIAIPNDEGLTGSKWVLQMVVIPDAGTIAPRLAVPVGRQFVFR